MKRRFNQLTSTLKAAFQPVKELAANSRELAKLQRELTFVKGVLGFDGSPLTKWERTKRLFGFGAEHIVDVGPAAAAIVASKNYRPAKFEATETSGLG